jgi:8-oxo-dGTP pyrophosphatase MutT (NUDIX family)
MLFKYSMPNIVDLANLSLERDERLKTLIEANLSSFSVQGATGDQLSGNHHAAVALAIVDEGLGADLPDLPRHSRWSTKAALLLTRRSLHLRKHAGQWALPGGRIDPGETAEQTALREMSEEVNLTLNAHAVLGRLDDFVTRSGFVITPVVIWAGPAVAVTPNLQEVASIHRIPVSELMRPDSPLLDSTEHSNQIVLRVPIGESWIAAPTAAMLYQFREVCILGRHTRVAHFEQPTFAWK